MPIDPLGGRVTVPADAAPYRNALIVTPDDDHDLSVIPNAITLTPLFELIRQSDGPPMKRLVADHGPYAIRMQLQNRETITLQLHSRDMPLPVRPRRIFATGTDAGFIGLLW